MLSGLCWNSRLCSTVPGAAVAADSLPACSFVDTMMERRWSGSAWLAVTMRRMATTHDSALATTSTNSQGVDFDSTVFPSNRSFAKFDKCLESWNMFERDSAIRFSSFSRRLDKNNQYQKHRISESVPGKYCVYPESPIVPRKSKFIWTSSSNRNGIKNIRITRIKQLFSRIEKLKTLWIGSVLFTCVRVTQIEWGG